MGGTTILLAAGVISFCTWIPDCFLSAVPERKAKTVQQPDSTNVLLHSGEQTTMLRARSDNHIEHADTADFQEKVLRAEAPVLVDFYADWCGPCRALAPVLEQLARENPNVKIVKVNVDENPELAMRYRVDAIPRLMVFKSGQSVAEYSGVAGKAYLSEMLTR